MWLGVLKLAATTVVVAGLAVATFWTIRVAVADVLASRGTIEDTEQALRLTPEQSEYYRQVAILGSDGNPTGAIQAFEKSLALNPSDSQTLIDLGFRYEIAGDRILAERYFLRAAEIDKQYLPAWTLANYYFRQGNQPQFWAWAKRSAQMLYGDPVPLFRLCGSLSEDGLLIERLDLRPPDVQAAYVRYLLDQGRTDVIRPAVERLFASRRTASVPVLLAVCDRLIGQNRVPEALTVWNRLAQTNLIPFPRLSATGPNLTNGNFAAEPSSQGFDWRLPEVAGVRAVTQENGQGLRLTFSGGEPESCELLVQFIPVVESTRHEMRFTYRTSGIAPQSGLHWRVTDAGNGHVLADGDSLFAEDEMHQGFAFATGSATHLARVALVYQRALGTTRIEGYVALKSAEVAPAHSPEPLRSRVMK